jgi:hypothetical protein
MHGRSSRIDALYIEQHSDILECRNCGQLGKIFWDEVSRRKPPYSIQVICHACGGIVVAAFPSASLDGKAIYN